MPTISELNFAYTEYRSAEHSILRELQRTASALAVELSKYLQLPSPHWRDSDGVIHQYVRVGIANGSDFKEEGWHNLPARYAEHVLMVEFAIALTLEIGPTTFPKQNVVFDMSLRRDRGAYSLGVQTKDGVKQFGFQNLDPDTLVEVFDLITHNVLKMYDSSALQ